MTFERTKDISFVKKIFLDEKIQEECQTKTFLSKMNLALGDMDSEMMSFREVFDDKTKSKKKNVPFNTKEGNGASTVMEIKEILSLIN